MPILTKEEFLKLPKEEQDAILSVTEDLKKQVKVNDDKTEGLKQVTMKELKDIIDTTIKEYIKPMTAVDRKFWAFPGIGKEGLDDTSPKAKYEKTIKFVKALIGGDISTARAISEEARVKASLSEGVATGGGFLVPEEFSNEVLRLSPTYGVIRANCRIIPMKYDVMSIPALGDTSVTASWVGEKGTPSTTHPDFKQIGLVVHKLASIPKVTSELLADANVDVISLLTELVAEAFAQEEDNQGFRGTGAPFLGLLEATGCPSQANASGTISALSYSDLISTIGHLYEPALLNAKFYLHRTVVQLIRAQITSAGAPIWGPLAKDIAGYPIVQAEKLYGVSDLGASSGSGYGVFGDMKRALVLGDRNAITMTIGTEGTVGSDNLFEQDMKAIRVIERIAQAVMLPSSFVVMKTV